MKVNALALGISGAIMAAACMLLLSIANALGIYQGMVALMQEMHMFYGPDIAGTITGMIEAAVFGFVGLYVLAWLYNMFAK